MVALALRELVDVPVALMLPVGLGVEDDVDVDVELDEPVLVMVLVAVMEDDALAGRLALLLMLADPVGDGFTEGVTVRESEAVLDDVIDELALIVDVGLLLCVLVAVTEEDWLLEDVPV